jgi:dTDP-4-amino-4,6-dideoxygalactose transaminase
MAIFNSLGSNYDFRFALRALLARNRSAHKEKLIGYLEQRYGGKALLVYKGREALRLALRIIAMQSTYTVGICGYTCYAVYDAVKKEGYGVRYLDISDGELHFSFATVKKQLQNSPSMRILILQNTLGYPADVQELVEFCRDRGILIIEDLAHCVGAKYVSGEEVGTVGDFAALSFSQDKVVDGVSGGALVVRNETFSIAETQLSMDADLLSLSRRKKTRIRKEHQFVQVAGSQQWRDRFYPLFTWIIRHTYDQGFGKFLHLFLKRLHLLSMPMNHLRERSIALLPVWYCSLIYYSFSHLDRQLLHRRKIAQIYAEQLNKSLLFPTLVPQISMSSNLRFPLLVSDPGELLAFLAREKIFVSDIWYDSPIAPKKYLQLTGYDHQCPLSEEISAHMVNLPTHVNVSEKDALHIAERVNAWLKLKS